MTPLPSPEAPPTGLVITGVTDETALKAFLMVHTSDMNPGIAELPDPELRPTVLRRYDAILPQLASEPAPLRYIGWLDGRAVATSRISIAAGAVGLYSVVTLATFRGRGYGHGVGLCVVGAGARALRGESSSAILKFYFPSLAIGRVPPLRVRQDRRSGRS